jgi:acyl-CoA synthetase (NDP forming)
VSAIPVSAPLAPLFHPRGVAFVGATPDPQRYGGRVVQYCVREGYAGGVHAVNPKYDRIFDVPCHRDLASIPGPVDVVVILVGPAHVPRLLDECRERGVRYAIALGDLVTPNAPDRDAHLAAIRQQIDNGAPRIVGPVCVGVISPHASLALTMSSGMVAGTPPKGGIGLVSQSGGVLSAVLDRAHQFGSGFSALGSSGSEFDLDLCAYVDYLIDDPHTKCIALYAEKILDAPRLFSLARRAQAVGKPILLMKAGASEAGARTALTHSGAIAGDRDVEDAAFRRCGIVRVDDIDDLHMSAELLCRAAGGPDGGVAAVSQSGGYGTVVADTLSAAGVPIADIAPQTVQRILAETPVPHVGNPHDSATGPPGNNAPHTRNSLLAFQDDPGVGVTLYAETMYMYQDAGHALQKDVTRYGRKPHLVCWQGGRATEPVIASLRRDGVLTFDSLRSTASALSALYRYRQLRREGEAMDDAITTGTSVPFALRPQGGVLADADAKALLRAFGIPLVPEAIATTAADAAQAALRLGFPVAVKGIAAGVAHKTELGLVALDLGSMDAVARACEAMTRRSPTPPAAFAVQAMIGGGVEFVVGVKADRTMGPAVVLGLGGVFVEALGAPVLEMAPLDRRIAQRMVAAVDRKGILDGYRTGRALGTTALVDTLVAVGRLAWALRDRVEGIDLNPVIVAAAGTYAVDAVVSLDAATTTGAVARPGPRPG